MSVANQVPRSRAHAALMSHDDEPRQVQSWTPTPPLGVVTSRQDLVDFSKAVTIMNLAQQGGQGTAAAISMLAPNARHISVSADGETFEFTRRKDLVDEYGNPKVTPIRAMPTPCTIEMFIGALETMMVYGLNYHPVSQGIASVRRSVDALRQTSGKPASDPTWVAVDQQNFARFQADLNTLANALTSSIEFYRERGVGVEIITTARGWVAGRLSGPPLTHLLTTSNPPAEFGQAQVGGFNESVAAWTADNAARDREQVLADYKQVQEADAEKQRTLAIIADLQRQIEEEDRKRAELLEAHRSSESARRQQQDVIQQKTRDLEEMARAAAADRERAAQLQTQVQQGHAQYKQLSTITADQAEYIRRIQFGDSVPTKSTDGSASSSPRQRLSTGRSDALKCSV